MADQEQKPTEQQPQQQAQNEGAEGHLYAYQRVGKYSPVVTAGEKASQFYNMAKDYNPHVKYDDRPSFVTWARICHCAQGEPMGNLIADHVKRVSAECDDECNARDLSTSACL